MSDFKTVGLDDFGVGKVSQEDEGVAINDTVELGGLSQESSIPGDRHDEVGDGRKYLVKFKFG